MSYQDDLDWLAMNVHEWPFGLQSYIYVITASDGMKSWGGNVFLQANKFRRFDKEEWLARRAELQNKPSWDSHNWPQIFQNEDGHWFGARDGWDFHVHIGRGWKGGGVSLLRDDGEWLSHGAILGDWKDTLERRPQAKPCTRCNGVGHYPSVMSPGLRQPPNIPCERCNGSKVEEFISVEDMHKSAPKIDISPERVQISPVSMHDWHERGELPPVGSLCLYVVSDRLSAEVEITAHAKFGLCFVEVGKSGESYVSKTAELHRFRPIRTERDEAIEAMKAHCPYPGSWETTYRLFAESLYDAGYRAGCSE